MANPNRFTVQLDTLQASTVETSSDVGAIELSSATGRAIELWVDVTAASGTTPTLVINAQTSIDDVAATNFVTQKSTSTITGTGAFSLVINRAEHALGKTLRVSWTIGGTTPSFTFRVRMIRME